MIRQFVITAVSDKHSNFCVSGVDINDNKHYRLVGSDRSIGNALKTDYIRLSNNAILSPLDCIEVEIIEPLADSYQPENLLVNESIKPKLLAAVDKGFLREHKTKYEHVYFDNERKILPSKLPINQSLMHSIELIEVNDLVIDVKTWPDRKKATAAFTYNLRSYKFMAITDHRLKGILLSKSDGQYRVGRAFLLITLGEEYAQDGYRYKIVASVYY